MHMAVAVAHTAHPFYVTEGNKMVYLNIAFWFLVALVEALEDIGASWHGVQTELEKYMRNVARRALAAHRKQGGE